MPTSVQIRKLRKLAEQCKKSFTIQGMAESAFIATARFRGFAMENIYQVATSFWPNGNATVTSQDDCNVEA